MSQHTAAARAVVPYDARPFLAQAIDAGLDSGILDPIDVETMTIDLTTMAFRYLANQQQDVRDLDAVGDAAEIVCMYIDDGLRERSGGDLHRAATMLASDGQPLLTAFRQSWGAFDQLRKQAAQLHGDLRNISVGPPGHTVALHPIPPHLLAFGSDRGLEDYADDELLDVWRKGKSVAVARERLRAGIALAVRQYDLLKLLPFGEVTARWRTLLIADGTFGFDAQGAQINGLAYDIGWASTLIRAVTAGDVGLVVTADDLVRFLTDHLRTEEEDGEEYSVVSAEALEIAARVLIPPLSSALGRAADDDVRYALAHAGRIIEVTAKRGVEDDIASRTGAWFAQWATNAVFLAVDPAEHTRAVESIIGPMEQGELVERFEGTVVPVSATEREEMLKQLDVARLPIADVARLVAASPKRAEIILRAAKLSARPPEDIELLATRDPESESSGHCIAWAILSACRDLSNLSDNAVFALLLNLPPTSKALRALIAKARVTPERLLQAFRDAGDHEVRQDWVRLAAVSPEHLVYLIGDIQESPGLARDVADAFQTSIGTPDAVWIPRGTTASCFLEIERVVRAGSRRWRKRALLSERGEPILIDPDLRWLWPKLPAHQQDAVRKAFRKAGRKAPRGRPKTPKPAKLLRKVRRGHRRKTKHR